MIFSGRQQRSQDNSLDKYVRTVEDILRGIGVTPDQARMSVDQGYGWRFRRGSALIEVYVSEDEGRGFLQVLSPIIHLPENNLLPLYRYMLELNLQLTSAALGIYGDVIYVFNQRPLQGLDADETDNIINLVAGYADDLDNDIVQEFGGRLFHQP